MWEFNKRQLFQVSWQLAARLMLRRNPDGYLACAVGQLQAIAGELSLGPGAQDWGGFSAD